MSLLARALPVVVVGYFAVGCTASLATLTPAKTTPGGHVRIAAAAEANLPTGAVLDQLQSANSRAKQLENGEMATQDDLKLFAGATVASVATPLTATGDLQLRVGLTDEFDIGIRYFGGTMHGDVRYQFLGDTAKDDTFHGSIGVGGGLFVFGADLPVPGQYDGFITIKNNSQYQVDGSLLFGWSGTFGHLWFGPKVVFSGFDTDATIALDGLTPAILNVNGTNFYYGGQLGLAIGIAFFWVVAEVTVAGVTTSGDATPSAGPLTGTIDASNSGLIIYPAGGLLLEF
ncbi:MAG: hypothetical protein KC417_06235 [Myxococcales bacterium]|nr:hypothetical protein [Myxococcales bacterium]